MALTKLETGVPGLDVLTLGGLPEGRATLIVGKSGTGKTVVGLQIATNLARSGIKTIFLAVEESPEDLQETGEMLGLGVSREVAAGHLVFADVTRQMDGPTFVAGEYDIYGLIHRIEALVKQSGAGAIVLDSASALFSPRPPEDALRGSEHEPHPYRLFIQPGGLKVQKLTSEEAETTETVRRR